MSTSGPLPERARSRAALAHSIQPFQPGAAIFTGTNQAIPGLNTTLGHNVIYQNLVMRGASSHLADAMGRFNFMHPEIVSRTGLALHGLAVTVRCRPGDNLMVHKALELARPGDIVVVDTCGNNANGVFGELMAHTAVAQKVGGIVVDGAIRDVAGL